MKLRISHTGDLDLIIQSNGNGTRRLRPLSWWEIFRKRFIEIPIGDNEIVIIRTEAAKEPDGVALRTVV